MSTCFSCEKPYDECRCGEPPASEPSPGEFPMRYHGEWVSPPAQPAEPLPAITRKELRAERDALRAENARLKRALELVEPWLSRISGSIGEMSDARLREIVSDALEEKK